MITSITKDLNAIVRFPVGGIFSTVLSQSATSNHTLMCLAKGTDISEHTSSREATISVVKGQGVLRIRRKRVVLKPGVFITMSPRTPHALRATEDLAILLSLWGSAPEH